jgi:histidinol-phosphate aminotransferase
LSKGPPFLGEAGTPSNLLNAHLAGLEEYVPIQPLEVVSERLGIPVGDLVKLDANENPYGPLPSAVAAIAGYPHYHIYPDPQSGALREALAGFTGVPAANTLPGQGADELLDYLCRLFLSPGDAVVNTPPTFGMYSFDAKLQGADVIDVPRRSDYSVDVAGIAAAVQVRASGQAGPVKLVFATSPNNPSGNWLADEDVRALLALPVIVVLDEAYVEFADHTGRAAWVTEHDNLVVLRTFSKAAGIAGLRLGYGLFPAWLMKVLWKYKQPYNVNVAAIVAGLASLEHADEIAAVVERLKQGRTRLYQMLSAFECLAPVPGSQANFVLCHVHGRSASDLKLALEREGVLVRHYAKPGLDNCIRISVGRPEHTDALRAALARVI